ncbi:hypothetical protein NL676_032093 [Syzygium grande]|nr:hypothetical protein NL676_032093 [Syzygium grande]
MSSPVKLRALTQRVSGVAFAYDSSLEMVKSRREDWREMVLVSEGTLVGAGLLPYLRIYLPFKLLSVELYSPGLMLWIL